MADDTTVTVSSDPPTDLLGLHADHVRVRASDATFRGMAIGLLELSLGDVQVLERTAGTVDGRLSHVTLPIAGGRRITIGTITIAGGGDSITATTVIPNAQAEALIADAVEARTGTRPSKVVLAAPDSATVEASGLALAGTFAVSPAGDLLLQGVGPAAGTEVVLLRGGEDLPIELTSVRVTSSGDLRLSGDLVIGILG